MKLRCVFKGHDWVYGRAAGKWARALVKGQKCYHNRACKHCGKEEWHADNAEKKADYIRSLKDMLGTSRRQAEIEEVDPFDRELDPDEFP
jgi:hypothetical protein